ncbi:MAG: M15 family metallopeptidase [Treponema sp.]|nr:M15 family metallopeptidase [Treponema sp.]
MKTHLWYCQLIVLFFTVPLFAVPREPENLRILRRAYPTVRFDATYDASVRDYKIIVTRADGTATTLYWANGKMLPKEKLDEQESYWTLFYQYAKEIPNPSNFSDEEVQRIRTFSSAENRSQQAGSSLYFFNAIYDAETRQKTEAHIKQVAFLGKYTNAHEWIFEPLARVENRIRELAKSDAEVRQFVDELSRVDSYNWREIGDRASRSFHSYGIAVDILPRGWGQKNIYWAWRRDIDPDGWMTLPLDKRWMPPLKVIQAFEAEGFIWGGKWIIWDNMHFEYHPELIDYNRIR